MKHSKAKENIKPKAQEQYEKATRAAKKQEFERQKKRARRNSKALPTQENANVQNVEPKDSQNGQPNSNLQMEYFLRKYWERIKGKNLG